MVGIVVGVHEQMVGRALDDAAIVLADRRMLTPEGDHLAHEREQRTGLVLLGLHVDLACAKRAVLDHLSRQFRLGGIRKAAVPARGPLHRRAYCVSSLAVQVVAHPDFVAIADQRRPRHREEQAVGELQARKVALEHGCEPPPDATSVDAHFRRWGEDVQHRLHLVGCETLEVGLVEITQEVGPLAVDRRLRQTSQRLADRFGVAGGERQQQVIVEKEVEHHVELIAVEEALQLALVLVHLAEHHRVRHALPDMRVELAQDRVRFVDAPFLAKRIFDEVGGGVYAEARNAEAHPEIHYPLHLLPHGAVAVIEPRLKVVEAVIVGTRRQRRRRSTPSLPGRGRSTPCRAASAADGRTRRSSRETATSDHGGRTGTKDAGLTCGGLPGRRRS